MQQRALQKGKIATLAQKKNLKNACAAYINLFITKIITSKYTNRRNKLIDEVYKYITSYNKLSSFKRSNRKLLSTNLTSLKVSA
ncbi:hypothetical protein HBI75_239150 [Parastagonospora nodorum]|nr:hypothetical protein HBI75_239150 [Parastagonospora nodorum]